MGGLKESEDPAGNGSISILDSSSRSLLDISWLGPIQLEETEQETEKGEADLYLPKWMERDTPVVNRNVVRIRVDNVYYEYPVERYPASKEEVTAIEEKIRSMEAVRKSVLTESEQSEIGHRESYASVEEEKHRKISPENLRIFFLWDRNKSEKDITKHNIEQVRAKVKKGRSSPLVIPTKVNRYLINVSLRYSISFVYVEESTVEAMVASLEKCIRKRRHEEGPALRLKKIEDASGLVASVLRAVPGITPQESSIIRGQFRSFADLSRISVPVVGVRDSTVLQLKSLFERS